MASGYSAAIKCEDTDGRGYFNSFQQLVHPQHQALHREVKRELNPVTPSLPAVQVCPINVCQGDAILVKLKYKEGMLTIVNVN